MPQKLPQIYTVPLWISVFGRLRDLQYIFALIYGTPSNITRKKAYAHAIGAELRILVEIVKIRIQTWHGNAKIGAHVWSTLGYLICLRHLFRSNGVTHQILSFRNDLFVFTCTQRYLSLLWCRHHESNTLTKKSN